MLTVLPHCAKQQTPEDIFKSAQKAYNKLEKQYSEERSLISQYSRKTLKKELLSYISSKKVDKGFWNKYIHDDTYGNNVRFITYCERINGDVKVIKRHLKKISMFTDVIFTQKLKQQFVTLRKLLERLKSIVISTKEYRDEKRWQMSMAQQEWMHPPLY